MKIIKSPKLYELNTPIEEYTIGNCSVCVKRDDLMAIDDLPKWGEVDAIYNALQTLDSSKHLHHYSEPDDKTGVILSCLCAKLGREFIYEYSSPHPPHMIDVVRKNGHEMREILPSERRRSKRIDRFSQNRRTGAYSDSFSNRVRTVTDTDMYMDLVVGVRFASTAIGIIDGFLNPPETRFNMYAHNRNVHVIARGSDLDWIFKRIAAHDVYDENRVFFGASETYQSLHVDIPFAMDEPSQGAWKYIAHNSDTFNVPVLFWNLFGI